MNMNKNDWTDELRKLLTDHQETVSRDLWADISQSVSSARKTARILSIKRISVAAAMIAALAAGGGYVFFSSDDSTKTASSHLAASSSRPDKNLKKEHAQVLTSDKSFHIKEGHLPSRNYPKGSERTQVSEIAKVEEQVPLHQQSFSPQKEEEVSQHRVGGDFYQKPPRRNRGSSDLPSKNEDGNYVVARSSSKLSLGMRLYAVNGIVGANSVTPSNGVMMSADMMSDVPFDNQILLALAVPKQSQDAYDKIQHKRPVSIGLQVDIPLRNRLSLTTGVVYTNAYSEFIRTQYESEVSVKSQSLHYIGVPVNLNYEVLNLKGFHAYISAGGGVDFNVKNATKYEDVKVDAKRDRVQWSANAAVGIQYDVVPQVGVYIEPGVKYYIDNGSSIDNTFKDKPFNFSFQFGLRLNLSE